MNKKIIKLNLIGLKCPLPVLKIAKKFKELNNKSILEVKADDPKSEKDIKLFCENYNVEILKNFKEKKILYFSLKKKITYR